MGVNLQETAHFRDTLWPLSPDFKDEDRKTYCHIRRLYLLGWEGLRTHVYDDGKGFMTVGVGFNMDAPGAQVEWEAALQGLSRSEGPEPRPGGQAA